MRMFRPPLRVARKDEGRVTALMLIGALTEVGRLG